jgi:hypothetical protein
VGSNIASDTAARDGTSAGELQIIFCNFMGTLVRAVKGVGYLVNKGCVRKVGVLRSCAKEKYLVRGLTQADDEATASSVPARHIDAWDFYEGEKTGESSRNLFWSVNEIGESLPMSEL